MNFAFLVIFGGLLFLARWCLKCAIAYKLSAGYVMFGLSVHKVHLAQFVLDRVLVITGHALDVLLVKAAHHVFFSDHVLYTAVMWMLMQTFAAQ